MTTKRRCLASAVLALALPCSNSGPAAAQSTVNPQADWNGSYGFASAADRNLRLLQSDLIEKREAGYYDGIDQVSVTNNTNTIHNTASSTVNDITQQQTTIGVISTATNNVRLNNSAGAVVDTSNLATTDGCVDSTIHIDAASPTTSGSCGN